jgi:hypothetical protein
MKAVRATAKALGETAKQLETDAPKAIGCMLLLPGLLKESDYHLFKYYDVSFSIIFQCSCIYIICQ